MTIFSSFRERSITLISVWVLGFSMYLPTSWAAQGQSQSSPTEQQPSKPGQSQNEPSEISNSDEQNIVRVRVPVVVVRAVVRDAKGNVVENLKKEDFQLRDNGKPQEITNFAIEHPGSRTVKNLDQEQIPVKTQEGKAETAKSQEIAVASRYVVLLLDDIQLSAQEAIAVRVQTMNIIQSLNRGVLVSVYSTSGRILQQFTSDQESLRQTVSQLMPAPMNHETGPACSTVTYYQAKLIIDFKDQDALTAAIDDLWSCKFAESDQTYLMAVQDANQMAKFVYALGDVELEQAVRRIGEVVARLSEMPGDRAIVFVSPGFASMDILEKLSPVLDRAIKASVVVSTVDARGLYMPEAGGDASAHGSCLDRKCNPEAATRFRTLQESQMQNVLSDLALGTGGTWFHNRNDLASGIRDALNSPPTSYVLAFSPPNRNLDGKYHSLKVSVGEMKELTVQARTGYFAARQDADPVKQAEAEFHDALFGQDEMNDLPIDVRTKFFLKQANEASLSVLTHIDVKSIHFRKVEGRNYDELTVGVAIFDQQGNFVTGHKRTFTLRLQDETLNRLHSTGMTVKMDFVVKPGTYQVRVVSLDGDGARISARNGGVIIPN